MVKSFLEKWLKDFARVFTENISNVQMNVDESKDLENIFKKYNVTTTDEKLLKKDLLVYFNKNKTNLVIIILSNVLAISVIITTAIIMIVVMFELLIHLQP